MDKINLEILFFFDNTLSDIYKDIGVGMSKIG